MIIGIVKGRAMIKISDDLLLMVILAVKRLIALIIKEPIIKHNIIAIISIKSRPIIMPIIGEIINKGITLSR